MARVPGRKTLARENMAQMAAAPGAGDLRAPPVGIDGPFHGSGNLVVELGSRTPASNLSDERYNGAPHCRQT